MLCYTLAVLIALNNYWKVDANTGNKKQLLKELRDEGFIKSKRIMKAMSVADFQFHIERDPYNPFTDSGKLPQISGCSPDMVQCIVKSTAYILEKVKDHLRNGSRALDIACSSAYLTACLGLLIGSHGYAVGTEDSVEVVEYMRVAFQYSNPLIVLRKQVKLLAVGNLVDGVPDDAPYDVIHIGIPVKVVPDKLIDQLKNCGRMIVPIIDAKGVTLSIIDKDSNGRITRQMESNPLG